jgi:hypothetical protein
LKKITPFIILILMFLNVYARQANRRNDCLMKSTLTAVGSSYAVATNNKYLITQRIGQTIIIGSTEVNSIIAQQGFLLHTFFFAIDNRGSPSFDEVLEFVRITDSNGNLAVDLSVLKIAGDVNGALAVATIEKIQNIEVSNAAPTEGQRLLYRGAEYLPTTIFKATLVECFDTGSGTVINQIASENVNTGGDIISFDTAGALIGDTTDYIRSATTIQVKKAGTSPVTYRITAERQRGNNRSGTEYVLFKKAIIVVPGTYTSAYNRNRLADKTTVNMTCILVLAADNILSLPGNRYTCVGNIRTAAKDLPF